MEGKFQNGRLRWCVGRGDRGREFAMRKMRGFGSGRRRTVEGTLEGKLEDGRKWGDGGEGGDGRDGGAAVRRRRQRRRLEDDGVAMTVEKNSGRGKE